MKKKIIILITSFFFLNLSFLHFNFSITKTGNPKNTLQAQTIEYPYKKYKDRKEGLIKKKTLVAGEKLVLISASIENKEVIPKNATLYSLGFYLKDSSKIKMEVREFDHYYKMEPLQDKYQPGLQTFSWPSEIPNYYNINLVDLFPLARISGAGILKIAPIMLYYENPKSTDLIYRFGFIPNNTIKKLEYSIYQSGKNEPLFIGNLRDLVREKIFHIQWNSKDNQNCPIPSGLLILNIKATFKSTPGSEVKREVTLNYQFYHVADFFKQRGFSSR